MKKLPNLALSSRGGSRGDGPTLKDMREAATWLADRAFGRPVQSLEHTGQPRSAGPNLSRLVGATAPKAPYGTSRRAQRRSGTPEDSPRVQVRAREIGPTWPGLDLLRDGREADGVRVGC